MAAGRGRRFGDYKQFMSINNQALVCHVVKIFKKCKKIDKIILIVPQKKLLYSKNLMKNKGFSSVIVIAGGKRRQDSVFKGIKWLGHRTGTVVIHDCVRPVINRHIIERGIKLCKKYHAVIMGTPITDTVKSVIGHKVQGTVDRKHLFLIQTPQFFDLNLLQTAYKKTDMKHEYTDEAGLLESAGFSVYLFKGDRSNIKITYKKDVELIKNII